MTRRRLLAAAAVATAAVAAGGCGDTTPDPLPLRVRRGARGSYLRGINSYTLNYLANDGDFTGEPPKSYGYLASRGHRIIRLPFEWGHVQPALGGPLDAGFLGALDAEIERVARTGMRVILDVHSGGCHPTHLDHRRCFGAGISEGQFVDLWLRLSDRYSTDRRIYAYDLMNEPADVAGHAWPRFSQAVVDGLRERGDRSLLWIEGLEYSLPGSWRENHPRPWIDDPLGRHVYSAHTYPGDAAREAQRAPGAADGQDFLADLRDFLDWLGEFGCRGSIGEVGWPSGREVGGAGAEAWNRLGDAWYAMADTAKIDVTYFGASSAYDNWLWAYDAQRNATYVPGLQRAESQAEVIEAHRSSRLTGATDQGRSRPASLEGP
jgi:endoglucanase